MTQASAGLARRNAPSRAAFLARSAGLLGLWVVLIGVGPADFAVGAAIAALAARSSLRLLPPRARRVRPAALAAIAARLLRSSVGAGIDVARRALDPRLPVRPGFVSHPLRLPPGPARDAFCAVTSLLPGTVPSGIDERGTLLVHCLDTERPVAEQLAGDERRFARAIGAEP